MDLLPRWKTIGHHRHPGDFENHGPGDFEKDKREGERKGGDEEEAGGIAGDEERREGMSEEGI